MVVARGEAPAEPVEVGPTSRIEAHELAVKYYVACAQLLAQRCEIGEVIRAVAARLRPHAPAVARDA